MENLPNFENLGSLKVFEVESVEMVELGKEPCLFPRSRVGTQYSNALRQNQIGIDSLILF